MKRKTGFSLLEISIVLFVMGLTITALLQMFDFSFMRYRAIANGWRQRAMLAEARIWLRKQVMKENIEQITHANLADSVKAPQGFHFKGIKVTEFESSALFIKIDFFEDLNKNGEPDKGEESSRLFCFRRRSA